ncbi:hypothetical protein CPB86DRAFT_716343 [Serendipita vermifera]|nr:hypothetical protein CPB86DRAFT_716343 [Serendipita vermifera]
MHLQPPFVSLLLSILLVTSNPVSAGPFPPWPSGQKANLIKCKEDILNHTLEYQPWLIAPDGSWTDNTTLAIGTDYTTCKKYCGTNGSAFQWNAFAPQFTGWLLPFLTLTAQLPYESDGIWHDLMSLFLTVGSPQLAMYSLALTILNSRHAKQRLDQIFSRDRDPVTPEHRVMHDMLNNLKDRVFQTLRVSQQQSFELGDLRPHPPNLDDFAKTREELLWWTTVQESLSRRNRRFTASLATQAAWVIIAFSFTWVDAFGSEKIGTNVTAFGLAIALCWSWTLVLVLGWFFAGVSTSRRPMTEAITQANKSYPDGMRRLAVYEPREGLAYSSLSRRIPGDVERAGPVYNYAKVFVWSHIADNVIETIKQHILDSPPATVQIHPPTPNLGDTVEMQPIQLHRQTPNTGHIELQPIHYLSSEQPSQEQHLEPLSTSLDNQSLLDGGTVPRRYLWENERTTAWKRAVHSRMLWAAVIAVVLNVATIGSAFWLDFLTPSVGLGCRSGGVLIYWMMSHIIWIVLTLSAWLSDLWSVHETKQYSIHQGPKRYALGTLAVVLRLFGKALATLNSAWIVIHCLFEFTQFYTRCWCQTNRMTSAWLFLDEARIRNLDNVRERWLGLALLTGTICAGYISFIGLWTLRRL